MQRPHLALLAALACFSAGACVAPTAPPGVIVATDPPGARILIDGRDSGWVTPMGLHLDDDERMRIDIDLPGYQPASVIVEPGGQRFYLILWREAYKYHNTWRFPLWLNFDDAIAPIKLSRSLQPSRIFVPLRLATNP